MTVGMFWSAPRDAQLLTFLGMRGQWLRGIAPRKTARQHNSRRSRHGNDDGHAHGNRRLPPHRANRGRVGQLLFLAALLCGTVPSHSSPHRYRALSYHGGPPPRSPSQWRKLGYSIGSQALNAHRRGMGHVIFRQRRAPKRPFRIHKINFRGLLAARPGSRPA
jgi:hypothetical protein